MPYHVLFTSFGFSVAFGWLVLKLFPKLGLMDRPERYGHMRKPIPYPGGIAIFFAFLSSAFIFLELNALLTSVLLGACLLVATAFVDDRKGLSPYFRLGIQILSAVLLVIGGIGISSISNPLGGALPLDTWNIPFSLGELSFTFTVLADVLTVVWVVTMVNAFNWIDGIPGMVNSVAAVASLILLLLSTRPDFHFIDQTLAITLSSIILGASLGFLIFDFPPPKILMGDTGSMLLGFLLAVTALISGGKIATTILVLGFPILDFAWVIGRRIVKKQSPFKGDLWHFHHRLQRAGFSNQVIVVFFAITAGMFGAMSLMLHTEGKLIAFFGILGLMSLLAILLYSRK